jgi:hypothetical protein
LESVPHAVDEFEDVSSMMPVSFIEGPATLGESTLGWTPVVPFAIIESIPELFTTLLACKLANATNSEPSEILRH